MTKTDSITFNFTYESKEPLPLDSVVFVNENINYGSPATMLFIEPGKGDKWKNRASVMLPADEFKHVRTQNIPCCLIIYTKEKDNTPARSYKFEISNKDWEKNTDIINKIFDIIKYNAR